MAQSRKDSRGYALRSGECQRADGCYSYSHTDRNRKRHTVYGKDLVELRKKEQQIRRDLEDGLDPQRAERVTVNEVYDSYIKQKYDLKPTTRTTYVYTYDHPTLKPLDKVEKSADAEEKSGFFTPNSQIDFSHVAVEPLFEEKVDFDTFSKSDFRAVKVKACQAVPKSKKLLQFTLDDGTGTDRTILSGIHAFYEPDEFHLLMVDNHIPAGAKLY